MNIELQLMLLLTRNLPKIRGAGFIANLFRKFYLRKKRGSIITEVLNFKMQLDPNECVDSALLFYPQLYDHKELSLLKKYLKPNDCFLDIGSNIGLYSIVASNIVGDNGSIFAFEADKFNYLKMLKNLDLNNIKNVNVFNIGLSDKHETLKLGICKTGNRGGNSFLLSLDEGVDVECFSLFELVRSNSITKISGMKIDIEGYEYKVLKKFFEDAEKELYPNFIVTEFHPNIVDTAGGSVISLLKNNGYVLVWSRDINYFFKKSQF